MVLYVRQTVPWHNGSLEVLVKESVLVLRGSNFFIEIRPRSVIISNVKDLRIGEDTKKKYIYIYLIEPIKPLTSVHSKIVPGKPFNIGDYQLRYTITNYDHYYTIITPGYTLYDYIVVSSDEIGIVTSRKREVYYEVSDHMITLYFV